MPTVDDHYTHPTHSIIISVQESEILKVILEFLETRKFHISQLSLERETGIINGDYSEDVLFLRQLILDGQWDAAIEFIVPMKEVDGFDVRTFHYLIGKHKFYELLCIKHEPGSYQESELAVEEIVECLKQLEDVCPSIEDFRRLCALLTLPHLNDSDEFRNWNPSSARVECFHKILPVVIRFLNRERDAESHKEASSNNERLIQLIGKGLLYESAVDYCQQQALLGKSAPKPQHKFTSVLRPECGEGLTPNPRPKLSSVDLSLVSWLEALGNEQFTTPFQQLSLDFSVDELKKPKLEARWAEQILQTPIKPGGKFPYAVVPQNGLLNKRMLSQSMILPKMISSVATEGSPFSARESLPPPNRRPLQSLHQMSRSTAPSIGFRIDVSSGDSNNDADLMKQSQRIDGILEASTIRLSGAANNEDESTACAMLSSIVLTSTALSSTETLSSNSSGVGGTVGTIRSHQPPSSLALSTYAYRQPQLAAVPEVGTPGSDAGIIPSTMGTNANGVVVPPTAPEHQPTSTMLNSTLLQQYSDRQQLRAHNVAGGGLEWNGQQLQAQLQPMFPCPSFLPPNTVQPPPLTYANQAVMQRPPPNDINSHYLRPYAVHPQWMPMTQSMMVERQPIPQPTTGERDPSRPRSFVESTSARAHASTQIRRDSMDSSGPSLSFHPICRYEDSQVVRTASFHPSGRYFAIGTNSRQLLVCKYPALSTETIDLTPKVLMSRPKQHRGSVYCCGFNQSGDLLATGSNDKTIRLMSFNSAECKVGAEIELTSHDGTVRDVIFMEESGSAHGSLLVSGGAGDCHLYVTDCKSGVVINSFKGHSEPILGLYAWGQKCAAHTFISCSADRSIRFWDLRANSAVITILASPHTTNSPVTSVCADPSGRLLVSGHEDASVMLYDIGGGRVVQIFRPHGDEVRTVRCSNAAYYLLSGSYDRRAVITDIRSDLTAPLTYLPIAEHKDKIIQARWHPHDFTFISTSADRTACLWALPSQQDDDGR